MSGDVAIYLWCSFADSTVRNFKLAPGFLGPLVAVHQAESVVFFFAFVAALVLVARKLAQPYPIVLVLAGLALSFVPRLPQVKLDPDIVFYFFLPPLIYPAALFTSWRDFRRNLRPIGLLSVGLVLVTIVVIAATALVALQFAVAALMTGSFSLGAAGARFILVVLGGIALGLLVGLLMRWIHRRLDDPPVQITISLLTPFIAYLPAERLHVSGILAVVAAGIFLGWH